MLVALLVTVIFFIVGVLALPVALFCAIGEFEQVFQPCSTICKGSFLLLCERNDG